MSIYPAGIAGDGDLLIARNLIETGLATSIDAATGTILVTNATGIVPNMLLTIEKEIVKVLGVNGNTIPISRALDGSTAASHVIGSPVSGYIVAEHHNALAAEVKAIETALGPNLVNVAGRSQFVGTMDASTGLCDFTSLSGLVDGPLPAAASGNNGFYVVVTVAGSPPSGPMVGVSLRVGDWGISNGLIWSKIAVASVANWLELNDKPFIDVRQYEFTRINGIGVSGDLSVAGAKTITFTASPLGVSGVAGLAPHWVYISGGTGTAEAVLITGGTSLGNGAPGTLTFTTVNGHTGAWTIASATAGFQEAVNFIPDTPDNHGTIYAPARTFPYYPFYATLTIPNDKRIVLLGDGSNSIITMNMPTGSAADGIVYNANPNSFCRIANLQLANGVGVPGTGTSGYYLRLIGASITTLIENVQINNSINGMAIESSQPTLRDVFVAEFKNVAISGIGTRSGGFWDNVQIINRTTTGAAAGFRVQASTNTLIDGLYLLNCGVGGDSASGSELPYGLFIDPGTQFASNIFINNSVFDSNEVGLHVHMGSAALGGGIYQISNSRFAVNNVSDGVGYSAGIDLFSDAGGTLKISDVQITGSYFAGCVTGIRLRGVALFNVAGNSIGGQNVTHTQTNQAIRITNSLKGTITGNTIGYGTLGRTATTGVTFESGPTDLPVVLESPYSDFVITGNKMFGVTNSLVVWGVSPPTNLVYSNNGGTDDSIPTIASATNLTIAPNPIIAISGTTALQTLFGGWVGRTVRLQFTNAAPGGVTTGGNISRIVAAVQNQILTLTFDGTNWNL